MYFQWVDSVQNNLQVHVFGAVPPLTMYMMFACLPTLVCMHIL